MAFSREQSRHLEWECGRGLKALPQAAATANAIKTECQRELDEEPWVAFFGVVLQKEVLRNASMMQASGTQLGFVAF